MIADVRSIPGFEHDEGIREHAYLVERGVRPMAIVGHVPVEPDVMLRADSVLHQATAWMTVISFVVPRRDGFADCGFAAAKWVVDLYEWLVQSEHVPDVHVGRITGLLLGYNPAAIRMFEEVSSGRRFNESAAPASSSLPGCNNDTAERSPLG